MCCVPCCCCVPVRGQRGEGTAGNCAQRPEGGAQYLSLLEVHSIDFFFFKAISFTYWDSFLLLPLNAAAAVVVVVQKGSAEKREFLFKFRYNSSNLVEGFDLFPPPRQIKNPTFHRISVNSKITIFKKKNSKIKLQEISTLETSWPHSYLNWKKKSWIFMRIGNWSAAANDRRGSKLIIAVSSDSNALLGVCVLLNLFSSPSVWASPSNIFRGPVAPFQVDPDWRHLR